MAILKALEAIRARLRFKDAYKAAARIGESVRKLPIERFISHAQRSKLTGVWPAHLGRIEGNERAPHLFTINESAKALGVGPSKLVDEK
jgi:transcriptional regulator with XRE-family HTH domain